MVEIFVVYKKRANSKPILEKFENHKLDDILSLSKRKPIIDYKFTILDIGIGSSFEDKFKEKYSINDTVTGKSD